MVFTEPDVFALVFDIPEESRVRKPPTRINTLIII